MNNDTMNNDTMNNDTITPNGYFELAIKKGVLSAHKTEKNFAGNYMFMGVNDGEAYFKDIITRKYLYLKINKDFFSI